MQKVPGIASAKVSLNDGLTILDFKPENSVRLSALRQVIRNNGFVTNESQVIVSGTIIAAGDGLVLEVKGSNERLLLKPGVSAGAEFEQLRARLKTPGGADLVISGTADTKDPKAFSIAVAKASAP